MMSVQQSRVLVVDDEPQICRLLKVSLETYDYTVVTVATGEEALEQIPVFKPDIILLDLGLPDVDGKELARRIRTWSGVPIIVLTARGREEEKIEALDSGADDYVTKPFSIGELTARMRASLRRVAGGSTPVITCGGLAVDIASRRVSVNGREVKLTPTEYEIMKHLALNAGKVLTHKQLLQAVWGPGYGDDTHYLRVYVGQLRRKIEENPACPRYIVTESGVGYRLME